MGSVSTVMEPITVTGDEGGEVNIPCPANVAREDKFFCSGGKELCSWDKNVIRMDEGTNPTNNGKYSLYFDHQENVFNVTITNLMLNNTATTSTPSTSTVIGSGASVAISIFVSLVILVLLLVFVLIIVYMWEHNKITAGSSASSMSANPGIKTEGGHDDGSDEDIETPLPYSSTSAAICTIYNTANLPRIPSDSLNYTNVHFPKDPTCPIETTVVSSHNFSTGNSNQSSAYSTIKHPHSSTEAPTIYSTVSQS
ncbi:hypothetical protein UPYG_G00299600 [Umbra pygmaea]|uniref:Uncharacterized protein n=1 Tax=Umbra pygmaea TaxID=75934 RepID=A0ABD0WSV1_UMBPY